MFLGCSGTTSLGGKWLFFISCLVPVCVATSLPSARRGGGAVALIKCSGIAACLSAAVARLPRLMHGFLGISLRHFGIG